MTRDGSESDKYMGSILQNYSRIQKYLDGAFWYHLAQKKFPYLLRAHRAFRIARVHFSREEGPTKQMASGPIKRCPAYSNDRISPSKTMVVRFVPKIGRQSDDGTVYFITFDRRIFGRTARIKSHYSQPRRRARSVAMAAPRREPLSHLWKCPFPAFAV